MRLPYVTDPPPAATPEEAAIIEAVRARRAPRPLQPLDLTLLHSPPVTLGWNHFLSAIRTSTSIPPDLRELAISRVAVVNRAWYEWMHHAPLASAAGVSDAGMEACKDAAPALLESGCPAGLTETQWLVLCYADEMTRNVEVRGEVFERVRGEFGERGTVEVTATIACYNCVSRFLVALDIGEKNGTGPDAAH
ncbi:AhpD-like protein [Podospora conica]|nr:AhpD-like protein [Schizothecium conicum]